MDALNYQSCAARTLIDRPDFKLTDEEIMIVWVTIGITGEAGELSEAVKHGIFHRHVLDLKNIQEELGDLIWYIAALCTKLNFSLSDIMEQNIAKLKKRYPNGYNPEDSMRRIDE